MVFKSFLSKGKDIDILASLPDGIMLVDSEGKIEWVNDAVVMLFNSPKSEILKLTLGDLIDGAMELVRQAAVSGKSFVGKVREVERDIFFEITAKSTENYFVVALRDVTQSYKTVTSLLSDRENSKKVSKDKNEFLVKLSNEIKSPIHSIIGFSQAMVDGLGGEMSEKQEKYIKIINKNSNEVLYLMDKILELSKTESNLYEYDFQMFDVVNSIQAVLKNHESKIKEKSLNLTFETEELSKRTVYSDENSFKTIINNLFSTSLSLTDIGSINIKLFHPELDFVASKGIIPPDGVNEKSYIMFQLTDTGAGIIESDLDTIFDPYAQLERPSKKNVVRSVALASAQNLTIALNGAIWIESEPMQGSTYSVIIPIEKNLTAG